jgi:hypothetical protein
VTDSLWEWDVDDHRHGGSESTCIYQDRTTSPSVTSKGVACENEHLIRHGQAPRRHSRHVRPTARACRSR